MARFHHWLAGKTPSWQKQSCWSLLSIMCKHTQLMLSGRRISIYGYSSGTKCRACHGWDGVAGFQQRWAHCKLQQQAEAVSLHFSEGEQYIKNTQLESACLKQCNTHTHTQIQSWIKWSQTTMCWDRTGFNHHVFKTRWYRMNCTVSVQLLNLLMWNRNDPWTILPHLIHCLSSYTWVIWRTKFYHW